VGSDVNRTELASKGPASKGPAGIDMAHLAAFAAVVDEGSFEAAARRLHVTPSAVSQRIKALEARMGRVLVRRGKPCRPTEAGQVLVRLAGQVALLQGEALADLLGDRSELSGGIRLQVAVNADSLATWFLPALASLTREHPVTFDIHQEDQDHSVALLRDGSVMAAVAAESRAVQGCRVELLGSMRYLAVASPSFSTQYLGRRSAREGLSAAPMLVFNRKDALQRRFLNQLAGGGVDPPVTFLPSSHGFAEAAKLGLGWGMVPEQMVRDAVTAGELTEIDPGEWLDVPLYWQRWRLDSPALTRRPAAVTETAAGYLRR
jgi:LysR family transcriptional regulator, chromosome initiation inhibitor